MAVLTLKTIRPTLVRMHRYTGLLLAAILFTAGLTGSLCAFQGEIDAALNPDLFRAAHPDGHLALSHVVSRLNAQRPAAQITALLYRPAPGHAIEAFATEDRPGQPAPLETEIFLDPSDGTIQGMRATEGCCLNRRALMPFLYRVHYSLDLGRTGTWIMGLSAILWSVDCVVGLILTLPPRPAPLRPAGFWRRWGKSWKIAMGRSSIRLAFDLHRAISLWLLIVLLGVAISGVALALGDEIFNPVVRAVLPTTPPIAAVQADTPPPRAVTLDEAEAIAAAFTRTHGDREPPAAVLLAPDGSSATFYLFSHNGAPPPGLGSARLSVDLKTGRVTEAEIPGQGRLGNLVLQMQFPWHSGEIAGLFGRIVICTSGLAVCVLTVTGVMIWWRKRKPARTRHPR
ncbi:PepSY domain-containing protein [Acetobacter sp. TBRC 12305]|uniref:PepSY domain-containing protein n=1 Tax=Acetobacter garciniae TaxID=2817435 RepID=A0A939HMR9_9PROT|nr:PepSY-associated TM helix domain-containing protein [Acetobacter garciniae]MBO1323776.1 PepSY domain-containing protein [Acetobacter garciniae]MBX0343465.1 PepSY domain-containing protein [Acetobacter garciniae]